MKRTILALLVIGTLVAAGIGVTEVRHRVLTWMPGRKEHKTGKYAEARDHILRARTLLGQFVRDEPGTPDAYFARLQAAALDDIFKTDVPVTPVVLDAPIFWRVLRLQTTDSYTKVTVQIENKDESRAANFYMFDRYPLALVANKIVYRMKKNPIERPPNVEAYGSDAWSLQPTQAITIDVYFEPLERGVVTGMLKYVDDAFHEEPARFSLVNVHQSAAAQ
jgi:hypothetical protein